MPRHLAPLVAAALMLPTAGCQDPTDPDPDPGSPTVVFQCSGQSEQPFADEVTATQVLECVYQRTSGNFRVTLVDHWSNTDANLNAILVRINKMTGPGEYEGPGTRVTLRGAGLHTCESDAEHVCVLSVLDTNVHTVLVPAGQEETIGHITLQVLCGQGLGAEGALGRMDCTISPIKLRIEVPDCRSVVE